MVLVPCLEGRLIVDIAVREMDIPPNPDDDDQCICLTFQA